MKKPIRVAVTGPAGNIGYSLLFRIAAGDMFGPDQPVILQLLDRASPESQQKVTGVMMELDDCAFPLLAGLENSPEATTAFRDADVALLVGARPRSKGMERADLLNANAEIFVAQGRALNEAASRDCKVLVVGNPCNTNALIAMHNASGVPSDRFFAMTRLDENRAKSQLAEKAGVHVTEVTNMAIWGNHSSTQYPDFTNARIGGKPVTEVIKDTEWLKGDFITTVQQRGAAIIKARGASSAASAASAAVDTVRSLATQTPEGDWYSVAVCSDGSYGIEKGLICSFPVRTTKDGGWEIVQGLPVDAFSREKIDATVNELKEERDAVSSLLKH